jgi:hypothetical protein
MSSTEFAALTFRWLNQVNWDATSQPIDVRVAVQLACHFNEEADGCAWPSYKFIGGKINVSEPTVIRSVRRLHKQADCRAQARSGRSADHSRRPV